MLGKAKGNIALYKCVSVCKNIRTHVLPIQHYVSFFAKFQMTPNESSVIDPDRKRLAFKHKKLTNAFIRILIYFP